MNPTEPTPTSSPPAMPYRVEHFPYGTGVMRATKVYPDPGRGGELLSDDEVAVWEYVKFLEAELSAARAESPTASAENAQPSPPKSKGKK